MDNHRWQFKEQTALVTGASAGIGLAIAYQLAERGADVLLVARDVERLVQVQEELISAYPEREIAIFSADVTEENDRQELIDWARQCSPNLQVIVNNVGGNLSRQTLDYGQDEWREILEVNLFSAFEVCRLAYPLLTQHAQSSIVNVGSVSGLTHVRTGAPYGMAKAALIQMTRNLAAEWAEDGIRVNAVAPWYIRTRRTSQPLSNRTYYEQVLDRTPMKRIGEPEEVACAVVFLCLPAASYITGECLAVDGGFMRYGF